MCVQQLAKLSKHIENGRLRVEQSVFDVSAKPCFANTLVAARRMLSRVAAAA